MDEHDQYESMGLNESLEDERDFDQIMADRRAAEVELDARDGRIHNRKLPQLLHDQGIITSSLLSFSVIGETSANYGRSVFSEHCRVIFQSDVCRQLLDTVR